MDDARDDARDEGRAADAARGTLTVAALWRWFTGDHLDGSVPDPAPGRPLRGSPDSAFDRALDRALDSSLDWAPDVAALTGVLLERSQAFRFVVSPPAGVAWPPADLTPFAESVTEAAGEWGALMERGDGGAPRLVRRLWSVVEEHLDTPVTDVADGRPWPLCEAVLVLHAIADEASAGCGGGHAPHGSAGAMHVARAQEMLARTNTLARFSADCVAQLPKTRTTPVGMTHRSLSRYTCTTSSGIPVHWHRIPARRLGSESVTGQANVVLLPWPLHIRETDFRPLPGSLHRPEREPFGFFEYTPSEPLDLGLVDRLLADALEEVSRVDVVVLPEGSVHESDVPALETVLGDHGVRLLVAGLRIDPAGPGRMPRNGVHLGVHSGGEWWHYRQNKHHRWFLDGGQVQQYNLAGALHPGARWWEAMEIPRRAVTILEFEGGITVAAVVCEDLARLDGVADLLREVAPTLVVTLLLDGPQLASRWTARYAGVLADDPGSAVLTLTSAGMAARSRPRGLPPSGVVAMWKDPLRGIEEIELEDGAQGVLLKTANLRSPRYAADGRAPADDAVDLQVAGVHQLRVDTSGERAGARASRGAPARQTTLETCDLSVLYSWTEAAARVLVRPVADDEARSHLGDVIETARRGSRWRASMGLSEPAPALAEALDSLGRLSTAVLEGSAKDPSRGPLAAFENVRPEDTPVGRLVHRILLSALSTALQV